jgi:hypothetical protein
LRTVEQLRAEIAGLAARLAAIEAATRAEGTIPGTTKIT